MKTVGLLVSCLIACGTFAADESEFGPDYDYDPAKYWNFEELKATPSYRPFGKPESEWPGLKAMLVQGKGPDNKPAEFFAYYGHPEGKMPEGGWPGVVMVHGGGGTAYPQYTTEWIKEGFAVISLDWYNRYPAMGLTNVPPTEVSVPRLPLPGGKRQDHVANVANMILSHSLLRSFPEVNTKRVVYVGLSWGSWYGTIVSAIDDRFCGAVEIYLGDRQPDPKKSWFQFVHGHFHHAMKLPMWWVVTPCEGNGTPSSMQNGWDHCKHFVGSTIVSDLGHSHHGFTYTSCKRMAKYFAGCGKRLPHLVDGKIENGVVRARVADVGQGIVQTLLWYSCDPTATGDTPNPKCVWQKVPAVLKDGIVSAPLPKGTLLCYLSAYEKPHSYATRDLCGSTMFLKP